MTDTSSSFKKPYQIPTWILPIIVISQFCCTSLWFAGNSVIADIVRNFNLAPQALGHLTSAVQIGFIVGTLIFAFLAIADRYSPSKVFLLSALAGAIFNLMIIFEGQTLFSLLFARFMTGFFLAGIYPVGMKIAADYYEKGLGKSLGYLVGALVLGTAFPHLLRAFTSDLPWILVIIITSLLAALGGGFIYLFVPNGPYRKPNQEGVNVNSLGGIFQKKEFRIAAFGYFGHMWELYAFWTFVPIMLSTYAKQYPNTTFNISLEACIIIGLGGLACVIGGYISQNKDLKLTAYTALLLSGLCCLISPFIFFIDSKMIFLTFLIFWGLVVIADSPLFSTLVAKNAPAESKGAALTIVNSIGFAITIVSIQLLSNLQFMMDPRYIYVFLGLGPALGWLVAYQKKTSSSNA